MDQPDALMTDLLKRWHACLQHWLETGAATPSFAARLALETLLEDPGTTAWPEVGRLGGILLHSPDDRDASAAALLDLLVWLETLQRIADADRLGLGESSSD